MNVQFRDRAEPASSVGVKTAIADCDIHPARATKTELYPYLARRWHEHLETYDKHQYQGMMEGPPYPKAQPNASRRDAYPPEGGPQGSSLSFMQQQHLDPNNVVLGVLNPLASGQGIRNHELSAALCSAINDWQIEKWTSKDSRLKGSIVVANEDGLSAAAEIRRRAGDKNFVQVLLLSRTVEPLGQRRYWPVYEAAQEIGLPVGIHAFGFGGNPLTPSGWPSFYIEEMVGHAQCQQSVLASLVLEGVFERFSRLKMVMIEAGFGWAPSLGWRLDKNFVQVLLLSRNVEPLGQRRYWPIYEAAEEAGLPVGVHAFGFGGNPITASGWPSFYIEEMVGHSQCQQTALASIVLEGVLERHKKLKMVMIEAGFGWAPSLSWRLDKCWQRLKSEVPHVKRPPSEYIRDHVYWTTQPMEDPERRDHLFEVIEWVGWDKLLFATDYPHWDYDDPSRVLPAGVSDANREAFYLNNALKLYGPA